MDAPFDHDGIDVGLNAADIENERAFSHDTRAGELPNGHSMGSASEPRSPRSVFFDLRRLSVRRARLKFVPRPTHASAVSDVGMSAEVLHGSRLMPSRSQEQAGHDNRQQAVSSAAPPVFRRVAVHSVKRTADAVATQCYGVFIYDNAGGEHALAQFDDATSATCAALRFGQMYRVGVEFGNFSNPKALWAGD